MQSKPLVSVIIATYNMGRYLPDAVDSVLNQEWKNIELIVVDDGSQDDTSDRLYHFESDPRFRYLKTENRGQPKAKNKGIFESSGDFIAFCDADDLWHPEKLKVQMPSFLNPKVGVVYSEVSYIDELGEKFYKPRPYSRYSGNITNELAIKNFIPFGTAVFRRACVHKNGAFDESLPMGIDWDLWLRYSLDWDFEFIPQETYLYRIWPGQMSKNYRGRYENAFRILTNFINQYPDALPQQVKARAWSDMYVSRAMSIASSERTLIEPLIDIITGLRKDIGYQAAWRSLAKLLLRRV